MKRIVRIGCILSLLLFLPLFFVNASRATVIYHGSRTSNKIYLTFDDGYSAKNTAKILDVLKEKNVPATFFLEGGFMTENPLLSKRIATEQVLANHTFTHVDITTISDAAFIKEIETFEEKALEITGKPSTKYFRPPMGRFNEDKLNVLGDLGYTVFMWDVQYYDYVPQDDQGVDYVINNILKKTQNGSIILMHTLTKSNANALGNIIDLLREKDFVFSSLSDLV